MSHVSHMLKLNCYVSMIKSFEQLLQIPGIKEIIEASNHGRGLMLNIEACKHEIAKIERNYGEHTTEASKVGVG